MICCKLPLLAVTGEKSTGSKFSFFTIFFYSKFKIRGVIDIYFAANKVLKG